MPVHLLTSSAIPLGVHALEFPGLDRSVTVVLGTVPPGWDAERDADVLDDTDRARAAGFARSHQRDRFAFGRCMLRRLLAERVALAPERLRFARAACTHCGGPDGRPFLRDVPTMDRPEFSVSYAGRSILIAVASTLVGVDLEGLPTSRTARRIATGLHRAEREAIHSGEDAGLAARFLQVWTRKEAFLKATGAGLARGLDADDLTSEPPGWCVVDREVRGELRAVVVVRRPVE